MTVTDGDPSCEITCARVVPAGNAVEIVGGNVEIVGGMVEIVDGKVEIVGGMVGIGATAGRPMFDSGNIGCGNTCGTVTITVVVG